MSEAEPSPASDGSVVKARISKGAEGFHMKGTAI